MCIRDSAEAAQAVDHEAVVHDLMPYIDRLAKPLERKLNDLDRPIYAGTKAARRRDQHSKWGKFSHGAGHVRHRLQP